jgi:hypothetical protein
VRGFLSVCLLLPACKEQPEPSPQRGPEPVVQPAPSTLRRLTTAEYESSLRDLFGEIVLPTSLEPDLDVAGSYSVGAGQAAMSPLGVERYEDAAYLVAEQVVADPAVVPCAPAEPVDSACAEQVLRPLGRRLWRRSLSEEEIAGLLELAATAGSTLGAFDQGLVYAISALLQSPHFLYRVELGSDGAFSGPELASRLSFLLWSGPPDDELLDLAEQGLLSDPEVRRAQAERMLADPRARRGLRVFFDDMLGLEGLDGLPKDPALFVHWSGEVATSAREETLALVEHLAFEEQGDFRDWLTTRTTFLDRSLAALYSVPAPTREGFAQTELPAESQRRGLLGQASFLALQSHSVSTSVTRRGLFVRTALLCQPIPPPPSDVDTSIPAVSADAPTMRERVAIHLEDPACASCHQVTDPIGLAFEPFDGIGRYRTSEDGHPIDPSGELDGEAFDDADELVGLLREHPDFPACLGATLLQHSQGHPLSVAEAELAQWHVEGFAEGGYRLLDLLVDIVSAESFARTGEAP